MYLPCVPDVVLGNPATYSLTMYGATVPRPHLRPCKMQCTALQDTCLGLLELTGTAPNCTGQYDYLNGAAPSLSVPLQYDPADDGTCGTVAPTAVGSSSELYRGGAPGVCSTYIPSDQPIFIPPSQSAAIGLAPMAPAGIVQTGIELQIANLLSTVPVFVTPECHNAMSKYICMQGFLESEEKTLTEVLNENAVSSADQTTLAGYIQGVLGYDAATLLGNPFYVPQYPDYAVCTEYATHCAELIVSVADSIPEMVPDCLSDVPGFTGVRFWQEDAIAAVSALAIGADTYLITSPKNVPPGEEAGYSPVCPTGFSIPDEIDDRTSMVPATACATNCITPLFTEDKWERYWQVLNRSSIVGLVLNVISLLVHFLLGDSKEEALLLAFIIFGMIEAIWGVGMFSITDPVERLCADVTRPLDARDGGTMCAIQSVVQVYTVLGMALCLCFEAVNWCTLDDNRGFGDDPVKVEGSSSWGMRKKQLAAAVLIPIIPVIILLSLGLQGFKRNSMICFFNWRAGDQDLGAFWVWFFFLVMISLVCSIITIKQEVSGKYHTKGKLGVTLHIIFVLWFSIVWGLASLNRFNAKKTGEDLEEYAYEWGLCVFQNYDGSESYLDVCGDSPGGSPTKAAVEFGTVTLFVSSLFVSLIFFPSTLSLLYKHITGAGDNKQSSKVVPVSVELANTGGQEAI